ncbi:MAG: ATP-dependent RNA helicase RhlE [Rubritalea sp.]|jgi:ATP-dependent RNA helicase RhlE|tara:strand:+ start:9607 stop:10947 length:1341 start_codon:yes stop_codon:yes gene_type:complete
MNTFADLGLSDKILRAVTDKGYEIPSPIQAQAIPPVLEGRDVLAAAQTGTGKTAGFTLPILHKLSENPSRNNRRVVRSLVMTPTRELAAQIKANIDEYGSHLDFKSLVVFGGVGINPQINKLRAGVDMLVATPGRLLDLCQQRACDLSNVEILVLDEADRMLDMGFINDIKKVMNYIPKKRQTLLFSATFSKEIKTIAKQFLTNPVTVEVAAQNTTAERVEQRAYRCDQSTKADLAIHLIKQGEWNQVLIFTKTKHGANRLSDRIDKAGITSSAIHGNKSQGARERALQGFKNNSVRVLVATDIAARGLDIAHLPHVINYELPNVPSDYVHRIGRTGRAGKSGEALSLVCNNERAFLKDIEKLISKKIPLLTEDGFAPDLWPDRMPSTSEVQREDAERKKQNRQQRGPRSPRGGGGGGGRGQGGGKPSSSGGRGGNNRSSTRRRRS